MAKKEKRKKKKKNCLSNVYSVIVDTNMELAVSAGDETFLRETLAQDPWPSWGPASPWVPLS